MEQEPIPNIPWHYDAEGYYIKISTDIGPYEIRDTNSAIYTHTEDPRLDHVFVRIDEDEETMYGFRLWRDLVNKVLGKGAYDALVEQMRQHDFYEEVADYPLESDVEMWEEYTKQEYVRPNNIERLVELAMRHLDAEWDYYQDEPGWSGAHESDMDR